MRNQRAKEPPECDGHCPAEAAVTVIGGRWKILILWPS